MVDEELTKEELEFENDMRINYITGLAILTASNIDALYNRFHNKHEVSLENIINISQDTFQLNFKEKRLLTKLIKKTLEEEYSLVIIDEKNLILKEIDKF